MAKSAKKKAENYANLIASCDTGDSMVRVCLLYTSPSPRDATLSRMPSSA